MNCQKCRLPEGRKHAKNCVYEGQVGLYNLRRYEAPERPRRSALVTGTSPALTWAATTTGDWTTYQGWFNAQGTTSTSPRWQMWGDWLPPVREPEPEPELTLAERRAQQTEEMLRVVRDNVYVVQTPYRPGDFYRHGPLRNPAARRT